jgi:5,10-methylenetetrahydromethanopterin reductase
VAPVTGPGSGKAESASVARLTLTTEWMIACTDQSVYILDMDGTELPQISGAFAPSLETPAHIELAERLGYRRAWCYDSPAVYADPWMVLTLAATRTRVIGLGPAALVPSLRHPVVTAAALATLAGLAPGRVSAAFGTGLTGRMLLGERPLGWAAVEEYVRTVRALLRGEEAGWDGSLVRLSQPAGFAAGRPADVAVLIAADGPRGRAVAAGLGDGVLTTRVPRKAVGDPDGSAPDGRPPRQVLLSFGTVLDDGEDAASPRAVTAAGPALAAAYHAIYEAKGASGVDKLPGGREWRAAIEAVEAPRRHLAVHDGHLVALGQHDQALLTRAAPLLASWTMTGTQADVRARLRVLAAAGITEVAYQPMGPDIPRELAAFARAAGLTDSEKNA